MTVIGMLRSNNKSIWLDKDPKGITSNIYNVFRFNQLNKKRW